MFIFYACVGMSFMFVWKVIGLMRRRVRRSDVDKNCTVERILNPSKGETSSRPLIKSAGTIDLSVVVPAYNEQNRLPSTIETMMGYLMSRKSGSTLDRFTYEVIIVDDGSSDKTFEIAKGLSRKFGFENCRVLRFGINKGKGAAVKLGVLSSRGKRILFADADNATNFSDLEKLERKLDEINDSEYCVICGSRSYLEEKASVERTKMRNALMHGFHWLVKTFGVASVKDTQCGFKLFTRSAADVLFGNMHLTRWAFDVEILYIAEKLSIPIYEVPVAWKEIEGSKIIPVFSWISMGWDILRMWAKYQLGVFSIESK